MQIKNFFGWSGIFVLSFLPVVFLFLLGDVSFSDYPSAMHNLGKIFGLVGMTMFSLNFLFATRLRLIEDIFGGLDKVYIVHGILGGLSLILILFHPIFLVLKFVPDNMPLAMKYLLPSGVWSVNLGIVALILMLGLIAVTLYTQIKYQVWKLSHKFLGLVFILAVIHIFWVRTTAAQGNIFDGYYIYAAIVSAIGILSFLYTLFLKKIIVPDFQYKVSSVKSYLDFFEIKMVPWDKKLEYKSGQFIFVRFDNSKLPREAHPFSIASSSNLDEVKIVVKKLGDFTSQLGNLNVGDRVYIEGPYGKFNFSKYKNKEQIWIAGGVGITPFLGMASDLFSERELKKSISLFYSAKDSSEFLGKSLFESAAAKIKNFKVVFWSSKEKGRFSVQNIDISNLKDKEFFICGPVKFKESIISQLIKEGVKEKNIHEEVFEFK